MASSSSSPNPNSNISPPASTPRKTSTFRRIPLRSTRSPLPSSPLAQERALPHSRTTSVSSVARPLTSPRTVLVQVGEDGSQTPPHSAASPSRRPTPERQLPPVPGTDRPAIPARLVQPEQAPLPRSSSLGVVTPSASTQRLAPPSRPSPTTPSASSSRTPTPFHNQRILTPYRPGFQPKGHVRQLTDEFLALRRVKLDGSENGGMKRVERTKLERRLEKLIALHFPAHSTTNPESPLKPSTGTGRRRPTANPIGDNRRASSFFDFDLRSITIGDAGDLWKNVVSAATEGGKGDIRSTEQRISPWQDDSAVSKCPLCLVSFHPLTCRKHHCRLCGQIICALPPKRPQRLVPCSLLFIVDSKSRKIEEVSEGVDYGVRKRAGSTGTGPGATKEAEEAEKFLKGVRICKQCRPVLLRQQYQQERSHVPTFSRLYETFVLLEKEIEDSLPKFQELILTNKRSFCHAEAIIEAFAQYDRLSKRIRHLPCVNGPGSSQDRVQMAVLARANLFLQKHMFPLQSLPTPRRAQGPGVQTPGGGGGPLLDPDSEIAHALQPLLEQEALLESFVEEAKVGRKFEDVKTLKSNLAEIRAEIEKIVTNAEAGMRIDGGKGKGKVGS
ncbi:hypothetical protein BD779DRAFT_1609239 [Infundibulicybe gibba]|nr:hypothetical protein BD779DRAFT_1609239 [Infundibulicybe gibba]